MGLLNHMCQINHICVTFGTREQRFPVLSSRNRNTETLGSGLGIVSESESSSKHVESRNRNRNRVLKLCSIGTGIGTEIIARVFPESESESGFRLTHKKHLNCSLQYEDFNSIR